MAKPSTKKNIAVEKGVHADVKKHIKKFRTGMKIEGWAAEAFRDKIARENPPH